MSRFSTTIAPFCSKPKPFRASSTVVAPSRATSKLTTSPAGLRADCSLTQRWVTAGLASSNCSTCGVDSGGAMRRTWSISQLRRASGWSCGNGIGVASDVKRR